MTKISFIIYINVLNNEFDHNTSPCVGPTGACDSSVRGAAE